MQDANSSSGSFWWNVGIGGREKFRAFRREEGEVSARVGEAPAAGDFQSLLLLCLHYV